MTHEDDVKAVIPPLSFEMHKGQYGKVGIVGGCVEYTGAPYYAGISALKTGVDLCHIFCAPEAATPIKCYSPELIVHPFLSLSTVEKITPVLGRLDALVVGPGLGRDPDILDAAKAIVSAAKAIQLPVVLDGDALFLLSNDISLIHGYPHAILTPNIMEYGRLCVSLGLMDKLDLTLAAAISPDLLATKLGHVTVLQKGRVDKISNGHAVVEQASQGSPRRCGGQGDVLAGSVGAFLAWHGAKLKRAPTSVPRNALTLAALGGSLLTRECARLAFQHHQRATTTPEMIASIHAAFQNLFG